MKISPVGVERHNKTVTFNNSFENVPKNGNGTHKTHSDEECIEQRGDLSKMMLQQTHWYYCS
jgi:hypothetical protein